MENYDYQVEKLEDITSVCVLEDFQKQEHLMMDSVLTELGMAEAAVESKHRQPMMTSSHFVAQYFTSFSEDPILKSLEKESEADSDDLEKAGDVSHGYEAAREALKTCDYDNIIR